MAVLDTAISSKPLQITGSSQVKPAYDDEERPGDDE
jgi:hypothetical protein